MQHVTTISVDDVTFLVRRYHNRSFWGKVNAGAWEPNTFLVLRRLLKSGARFVDVGAWIGPTALFAASLGADVTAFECDPTALDRLYENVFANPELASRITVIPAGLAVEDGPFMLHASTWGNSESSIFPIVERRQIVAPMTETIKVQGLAVRRALRPWLNDPGAVIKMDVEGAEYSLLSSLGNDIETAECAFYISFHPQNLVSQDSRPDRLLRLRAALDWVEQFWDYVWWTANAENIEQIDKDALLGLVVAGKSTGPILFTRGNEVRLELGAVDRQAGILEETR